MLVDISGWWRRVLLHHPTRTNITYSFPPSAMESCTQYDVLRKSTFYMCTSTQNAHCSRIHRLFDSPILLAHTPIDQRNRPTHRDLDSNACWRGCVRFSRDHICSMTTSIDLRERRMGGSVANDDRFNNNDNEITEKYAKSVLNQMPPRHTDNNIVYLPYRNCVITTVNIA